MKRQVQILVLAVLAVALLALMGLVYTRVVTAEGDAPTSYKLPQRWEYAVKFVCGLSSDQSQPPSEPDVKPGNYATKINVHNPNANPVILLTKVAMAAPMFTTPITPTQRIRSVILPDFAESVNCTAIVKMLGNSAAPLPPFIEGYFVIDALPASGGGLPQLDVDSVYTTAQPDPAGGSPSGEVNSIEVNRELGRVLPAGTWPY